MALFKIFRGNEKQLPITKTDGYAYFCTDTGSFFIDHLNNKNELVRSKISANYADKLRDTKDGKEIELSATDITAMIDRKPGILILGNREVFNDYDNNQVADSYSHAEGTCTTAFGEASHAEGNGTTASGSNSHAEGNGTYASGSNSHAEGSGTHAVGNYSHAEGSGTHASGERSHAEGGATNQAVIYIYNEDGSLKTNDEIKSAWNTNKFSLAKGDYSHVEGRDNLALGNYSHAEGGSTTASGNYSHAEGYSTTASSGDSHAEGNSTTASGYISHAEGARTTASGNYSHAEGYNTVASGTGAHAEGYGTKARGQYSHVQGKYNIEDTENKYAHIVGNGTSDTERSNIHTIDWNGNAWFAGNVKIGGTAYNDKNAKTMATEEYVDDAIFSAMESISPEQHAAVFRGKNLGSAITDAQKAAIADGSFKDLFIGDYWVINNITWRIADMDYWYNTSKNALTRHHLVMIPDTCLFEHIMRLGSAEIPSTTKGGYHLTDMHREGMRKAQDIVIKAFGANMCVSHKEAFVNAVTNGKPSGFLFEDSWLDLPTEIMMYGTNIFSVASDGGTPPPAVITYCRTQLALFDIAPKFIVSPRQTYWLRDIVSEGQYAAVNAGGYATHSGSEFSLGVRPVFCIG